MPPFTPHAHRPAVILVRFLYFFLCVLCALCGSISAQDFKSVRDGVEYADMTRTVDGQPVRMNLLRLDLTKVRLDVVHAMDAAIGTETVSSMAKRHGAFAAINAGFFRLDKSLFAGDNVGVLIVNKELFSEPTSNRIAIGISNGPRRTEVSFDRWQFVGYLQWKKEQEIDVLRGFNRELKNEEVVVFTSAFGSMTPTKPEVLEVIVRSNHVVSLCSGNCKIPKNGFVLSGSGAARNFLKQLRPGDFVKLNWDIFTDARPRTSLQVEDIVAGTPQLVKNGKIDITWEQEKTTKSFVETRHPRTAVAKLKDGKFLMITVDGRSESSGGISLPDLAELLLEFGATDAINLDGGGSTTMYLDGKVVNHPSDKEGERKVSDAILVTLRRKHDR